MSTPLTVMEFPGVNIQDIPRLLRQTADDIEAGEYGDVNESVFVLSSSTRLCIFGWGINDSTSTFYLLHAAAAKMLRPCLEAKDD